MGILVIIAFSQVHFFSLKWKSRDYGTGRVEKNSNKKASKKLHFLFN